MAIKVMTLVWERAPYKGHTLLVLLALADWANDSGYCYPKVTTLARKARTSRRKAQYAIDQLAKDGYLEVVSKALGGIGQFEGGKRRGHEVIINVEKLRAMPPLEQETSAHEMRRGKRFASGDLFSTTAQNKILTAHNREISTGATAQIRTDNCANPAQKEGLTRDDAAVSSPHPSCEPSDRHEPSVEPSGTGDLPLVESSRWTWDVADDGSYSAERIEEAYRRLTGLRVGRGDHGRAATIGQRLLFSSRFVEEIFAEVKRRAGGKRIGSFAYFQIAIEEFDSRCDRRISEVLRMQVGASAQERLDAMRRAVRREFQEWKNSGPTAARRSA